MVVKRTDAPDMDSLGLSLETLAFIILKARSYDAQSGVSHLEEGSNPSDDREVEALESRRDNPARAELRAAIAALTPEEQASLVALTWIGRGDFGAGEWADALNQARERHTGSTSRYLMGIPQLGDFLEEGAATLGFNLSEIEGSMLG
jgi:hypothetical protein